MSGSSQGRFNANTKPINDVRIDQIKEIFPEVWIEGRIRAHDKNACMEAGQ